MADQAPSFLSIVDACDNFRLANARAEGEHLVPWTLARADGAPIGLLRPPVVAALRADNDARKQAGASPRWVLHTRADGSTQSVSFAPDLTTASTRGAAMRELCEGWRDAGTFAEVCGPKKWRGELYAIYRDPFGPPLDVGEPLAADLGMHNAAATACPNFAFAMERSACALFGVVTYGVHMNAFEPDARGAPARIWVPRRAANKSTWPGMLDNTVAGGISAGMGRAETVVKEAGEEAGLPEAVVRTHMRGAGAVSYFAKSPTGWLQPEVEYVYDVIISPGAEDKQAFKPKPVDGEVESFELMDVADVIKEMRSGHFKPNCALVLVDLFIRTGLLTPENEPHFLELTTRMRGRFEYERWSHL